MSKKPNSEKESKNLIDDEDDYEYEKKLAEEERERMNALE